MIKSIKEHLILYADLSGMRASENPVATIPEDILVTSAWPDIVLMGENEVTLIELTIPHESLHNAGDRKSHKEIYLQAPSDFEALYSEIGWLAPKLKAAPSITRLWMSQRA